MISSPARAGLRIAACAMLGMITGNLLAADFAPEVYRDEFITIKAGLASHVGAPLQFGDLVDLIVAIEFDPESVVVSAPAESFFSQAWPEAAGPVLAQWQVRDLERRSGGRAVLSAQFQFQFLACPNDEQTCPGNRTFLLPDFSLRYRTLDAPDGDAGDRIATFRIAPERLTVATGIERDEEAELRPFNHYFPAGGYPQPLAGADERRAWLLTTAIALVILIGGSRMWFFRKQQSKNAPTDMPRWQSLLAELEQSEDKNSAPFADNLRRCLVWFCYDELKIDPFDWLDLAETADDADKAGAPTELRRLFVALLHQPAGRGEELLADIKTLALARQGA